MKTWRLKFSDVEIIYSPSPATMHLYNSPSAIFCHTTMSMRESGWWAHSVSKLGLNYYFAIISSTQMLERVCIYIEYNKNIFILT